MLETVFLFTDASFSLESGAGFGAVLLTGRKTINGELENTCDGHISFALGRCDQILSADDIYMTMRAPNFHWLKDIQMLV